MLIRTQAHARKSFRMYAEDQKILCQLSHNAIGFYMKLLCEAASLQSAQTEFPYHAESAGIPYSVFKELEEKGLISKGEAKTIIINGFEQRLTNQASKARKRRFDQKKREQEIKQLCKSIIKNKKPEGVPDDAIVWGGNEKRWARRDDVAMAMSLHKYIESKGSNIELGITFINQVRLLRQTVGESLGHNKMIHVYKGLDAYFAKGGVVTTGTLRAVLESTCL